jgi:hypothetical protein
MSTVTHLSSTTGRAKRDADELQAVFLACCKVPISRSCTVTLGSGSPTMTLEQCMGMCHNLGLVRAGRGSHRHVQNSAPLQHQRFLIPAQNHHGHHRRHYPHVFPNACVPSTEKYLTPSAQHLMTLHLPLPAPLTRPLSLPLPDLPFSSPKASSPRPPSVRSSTATSELPPTTSPSSPLCG